MKNQRFSVNYSDGLGLFQYISNNAFYTNEQASYGFYLSGIIFSLEGGFSGYIRDMNSNLNGDIEEIENIKNDISTNYFSIYTSPKIEYTLNKVEFTIKYPFNFTHYNFNQNINNQPRYFHSDRKSVV